MVLCLHYVHDNLTPLFILIHIQSHPAWQILTSIYFTYDLPFLLHYHTLTPEPSYICEVCCAPNTLHPRFKVTLNYLYHCTQSSQITSINYYTKKIRHLLSIMKVVSTRSNSFKVSFSSCK